MSLPKKPVGGGYGIFCSRLRLEEPNPLAGLSAAGQATKASDLWETASEQVRKDCDQCFWQAMTNYRAKCDEIPEAAGKKLKAKFKQAKLEARQKEKPKVPVGGGFGVFSRSKRIQEGPYTGIRAPQQTRWLKYLWDRLPSKEQQSHEEEFQRQLAKYHGACP